MGNAFWLGMVMGLPGSMHCLGMCGPLALMVGIGKRNPWKSSIMYHLSRAMAYGMLGVLVGLVFQFIDIRPYQQQFSLFMGLFFLVAWILSRFNWGTSKLAIAISGIFKNIPNFLSKDNAISTMYGGFINGLLPCGLVYSALLVALGSGSTVKSAVFMLGFGLATIPMLFFISGISQKFKMQLNQWFYHVSKWWLLIMAVLFLLRGANLGIPYVSPKLNNDNPKENCCRHR